VKNLIRRMAVAYILVGGWIAVATPVLEARTCPPGTRCVGRDLDCSEACTTARDECCFSTGLCVSQPNPCWEEARACDATCCLSCEPI
jgi:hypothetical protein